MSKTRIYKEILREYDRDRTHAAAVFEKRKAEVYGRCPRIEEIDSLLAQTGIRITKAILSKTSETETLAAELKRQNDELLAEKDRLLIEHGFPKQFLTSVYKCQTCKDTGYAADNQRCKCFSQRLITHAYDMSNLGDVTSYENFDMFDFRYYSDKPYGDEKRSPKEKMQKIYSSCLNFVDDFDKTFTNLLFYGSSGLGKTFLCHSIAKDLLDKGKTVIYVTAFELFKMVEHERFDKDELDEPNDFLDMILTVDLLIIDDLGTEFSTILSSSELFNFLNTRLIEKKSTVISTNLSPGDLIHQYSDRIVSRLYGNYKVLNFFGDDIRILKKHGNA